MKRLDRDEPNWNLYLDNEPPEEPFRVEETTPASAKPEKALLRTPLANLLLSARIVQTLEQQGLLTLGHLKRLRPSQLAQLPGIGARAREEILEALDYYALELQPEYSPVLVDQLCLPKMNDLRRRCPVYQTSLPIDTPNRFCSASCRHSRPVRNANVVIKAIDAPPRQLSLELEPN